LWSIPGLGILGVICTAFYISGVQAGVRLSVFGTCLAIAGAAVISGGIIGFLFGIPRTLQGPDPSTGDERYKGNTNLEQVSDWLTKIIVGIGLVQIGRLLPALSRLAENLKEPLGGRAWSGTFGLALIISYALLGFFFLYLWSRSLLVEEWKDPNTARPSVAAQAPSTPVPADHRPARSALLKTGAIVLLGAVGGAILGRSYRKS
jgi:hypothetical protein